MNRSEYYREKYTADHISDLIWEEKEKKAAAKKQLLEAIDAAMEDITDNHNAVLTYEEYMDELSFYFDSADYEMEEAFVRQKVEDLEEREQEDWEE